jgi:CRP-like cAMP-binding protein
VSNGVALGAKLSQRDLANMIGASRESVNRQLSLWEEEGLISRDRGAITILDSAALQMLVGAEA